MSDATGRSEADLLVLTRADCVLQNRHRDAHAMIDLEATEEFERARHRPRRTDPTDDKVNEAFKRATSC
jgi:hypothetical protein